MIQPGSGMIQPGSGVIQLGSGKIKLGSGMTQLRFEPRHPTLQVNDFPTRLLRQQKVFFFFLIFQLTVMLLYKQSIDFSSCPRAMPLRT